ncbi:MAG: hypothetical protein QOJ46_838 [bacterium]
MLLERHGLVLVAAGSTRAWKITAAGRLMLAPRRGTARQRPGHRRRTTRAIGARPARAAGQLLCFFSAAAAENFAARLAVIRIVSPIVGSPREGPSSAQALLRRRGQAPRPRRCAARSARAARGGAPSRCAACGLAQSGRRDVVARGDDRSAGRAARHGARELVAQARRDRVVDEVRARLRTMRHDRRGQDVRQERGGGVPAEHDVAACLQRGEPVAVVDRGRAAGATRTLVRALVELRQAQVARSRL